MKKCNNCREVKFIEFFYNQADKKDGKKTQCKECIDKKHYEYMKGREV